MFRKLAMVAWCRCSLPYSTRSLCRIQKSYGFVGVIVVVCIRPHDYTKNSGPIIICATGCLCAYMCTYAIIVCCTRYQPLVYTMLHYRQAHLPNIVWFLYEVERRRKIHCGFLFKIHWNQAKIFPTCKVDIFSSPVKKLCMVSYTGQPASSYRCVCLACATLRIHTYISNIEFFFSSSFVFFQFRSKPAWFRCRTCICSELRMTRNISFTYQMNGCLFFFFSVCCF